jgi:hypothetical protein
MVVGFFNFTGHLFGIRLGIEAGQKLTNTGLT